MFRRLLKPVTFFIISFLFMIGGTLTTLASSLPPADGPSAVIKPPQSPPAQGDPEQGQYIFSLAGGCGCHNGQAGLLAGGTEFEGPFGVVYATNVTPDEATGIGTWSDQEIIDAIRLGEHPGGERLFPIMPYPAFSQMADQDVQDLVAFMRTVQPVENELPARDLQVSVPPFSPPAPAPAAAPQEGVARGEYIATAIAHCGECHTPRTPEGRPDRSMRLAGAYNAVEGFLAPNITPDEETGIGSWSQEDIVTLLQTGQRPDGSQVGGVMMLSIEGGYKNMTAADAQAVADYLQTVPAVENVAQPPGQQQKTAAAPQQEVPQEEAPETLPTSGGVNNFLLWLSGLLILVGLFSSLAGVFLYRRQQ